MQFDRREHPRFHTSLQAFVNMHDQHGSIHVLGQLLDISLSGLALSYLPEIYGSLPSSETDTAIKLDIFISGQSMFLEGFSSQLVYDLGLPSFSPITVVSTRKCGLSFTHLNDFQTTALRHFIRRSSYAFA
jgi:hypothetical protein